MWRQICYSPLPSPKTMCVTSFMDGPYKGGKLETAPGGKSSSYATSFMARSLAEVEVGGSIYLRGVIFFFYMNW